VCRFGGCGQDRRRDDSPGLFGRVVAAQIARLSVWGGVIRVVVSHFDAIENRMQAASDHAVIVVGMNIR